MSIGDELISRLGKHSDYMRGIKESIYSPLDAPEYSRKYIYRFNYRYDLRHCRKLDADKAPLSKELLLKWHLMATNVNDDIPPCELWSDPDTNDQICRLLLEDDHGCYDHEKVDDRRVSLGEAGIYDLPQAGRRYVRSGIFLRNVASRFNLRIVNYLLPFSVQPN